MKSEKNVQRSTANTQRPSGTNVDVQRSATNHPLVQGSGLRVQGSGFPHTPSTTNHTPSHPNSSFPTPNFSARTRAAFTLFELLAVITIIGIVLAVTLGSFTGWGDAQAVRGSVDVVEAALSQAHDYAVARRVPISFEYQTAVTNMLKKTATFQFIQESSLESATNLNASTSDTSTQCLGSSARLPGSVWLLRRWQSSLTADDAEDRFVFLPNGRVLNPVSSHSLELLVVSRKTRSDGLPCVVYHLSIDPTCGALSTSKFNVDSLSGSLQP